MSVESLGTSSLIDIESSMPSQSPLDHDRMHLNHTFRSRIKVIMINKPKQLGLDQTRLLIGGVLFTAVGTSEV